jgi:hypothetical protein
VGYVGSVSINVTVYDGSGIFSKQTTTATIATQTMNTLLLTGSQTNPYFTENSLYTLTIQLATTPPASSLSNSLILTIPAAYNILNWSCVYGCSAPTSSIAGALYFPTSSTNIKLTVSLTNPVTFLSPISLTSSSSQGYMDYG